MRASRTARYARASRSPDPVAAGTRPSPTVRRSRIRERRASFQRTDMQRGALVQTLLVQALAVLTGLAACGAAHLANWW